RDAPRVVAHPGDASDRKADTPSAGVSVYLPGEVLVVAGPPRVQVGDRHFPAVAVGRDRRYRASDLRVVVGASHAQQRMEAFPQPRRAAHALAHRGPVEGPAHGETAALVLRDFGRGAIDAGQGNRGIAVAENRPAVGEVEAEDLADVGDEL